MVLLASHGHLEMWGGTLRTEEEQAEGVHWMVEEASREDVLLPYPNHSSKMSG